MTARIMSKMPLDEVEGLFRSVADGDGTVVRFVGWTGLDSFLGIVVVPGGDYPYDIPVGHVKSCWNPAMFAEYTENGINL